MAHYNDEHDLDLLVRISEMYYIQDKTQKEISEALGLSRSGVSRLLAAAKRQGIVRISVVNPAERLEKLAEELASRFGLKECRVCPSEPSYEDLQARLAYQAGELFLANLKAGDVVGLGLSSSIHRMVELMPESSEYPCLQFVPVSGGTGWSREPQINYTVQLAASKLHGDYVNLNIPLFINEPTIVARLLEEESIKEVISLWDQLSICVVGIGAAHQDAPQPMRIPAQTPSSEATAAVCGWFFDDHGRKLEGKPTASVSIEQLRRTPTVMAIAGGRFKATAVLSVLRAGFCTHLVTDEDAARAILHMTEVDS